MSQRWFFSKTLVCCLLALFGWAMTTPQANGQAKIDPMVLKKVKGATVHIKVKGADGSVAEGSGFFGGPKGIVVTNAHVVGMLDNESRKPAKIEVTINSGEDNSKTYPAQVHYVDGEFDLALLRIAAKVNNDIPERLNFIEPGSLVETQDLFVFGFPLGTRIGSNVTVTPTSVTSLRKENGNLKTIQVNGGLHHGNSGGPLVTKDGLVACIAVAGYTGTQIHMAIPIESLNVVTNGRIITVYGTSYKEGNKIHIPVRVEKIDPLGRMKSISVLTWTGPALKPGEHERPSTRKEPEPRPGDSAISTLELKPDAKGVCTGEIVLSEEKDPKLVYWSRYLVDKGTTKTWYGERVLTSRIESAVERKPVTFKFAPALGKSEVIALNSDASFRIREVEHADFSLAAIVQGTLKEQYIEQAKTGAWRKSLTYDGLNVTPTIDKRPIDGVDALLKALNDIKLMTSKIEMKKDGSVSKHVTDFSKVPQASLKTLQLVTKQARQSLDSLAIPLPANELKPLATWKGRQSFMVGASRWVEEADSEVTYTYQGLITQNNTQFAVVTFEGELQSPDEDQKTSKVRGRAEGRVEIALDTGLVGFGTQNVKAEFDLTDSPSNQTKGVGTLNVTMRRNPPPPKKQ